jgi:hypothetical protein
LARDAAEDKRDLFVAVKGKGKHALLSAPDLLQLQEIWGKHVPGYGLFVERFEKRNARLPLYGACVRGHSRLQDISKWKNRHISQQEKQWQLMDGNIMVSIRAVSCFAHMHLPMYTHRQTVSFYRTPSNYRTPSGYTHIHIRMPSDYQTPSD